jgi:16S rRNA processing protein RimM
MTTTTTTTAKSATTTKTSSRPCGRDLLVELHDQGYGPSDLVTVARLGKPWGLCGQITVRVHNPNSECEWTADVAFLHGEAFPHQAVEIERWTDKGGKTLVKFAGINTPEDASSLTHLDLLVPREWLGDADLDDDEHLLADLIGVVVTDVDRGLLGRIVDVFNAGATDVWVVQGEGGEELIPAVKDFVLDLDLEARTAKVRYEVV